MPRIRSRVGGQLVTVAVLPALALAALEKNKNKKTSSCSPAVVLVCLGTSQIEEETQEKKIASEATFAFEETRRRVARICLRLYSYVANIKHKKR